MKNKIIRILVTIFCVVIFCVLGLLGFISYRNKEMVAILGYHGVLPKNLNTSGDGLIVDSETFEGQIKTLKNMGYKSMTMDEFYCWKTGKCSKKQKSILITFDDGYQNNYDYAFEILKKYDMNAVVFLVGEHIMMNDVLFMNQETINKSLEEYPNIEFASHSYNLHYRGDKSYNVVVGDIVNMKEIVDSNYYAYPFGEYNDGYINALKENNYKLAFTFGPGKEHRKASINDDNYKIPRLNIGKDMSIIKFILRIILPI